MRGEIKVPFNDSSFILNVFAGLFIKFKKSNLPSIHLVHLNSTSVRQESSSYSITASLIDSALACYERKILSALQNLGSKSSFSHALVTFCVSGAFNSSASLLNSSSVGYGVVAYALSKRWIV